MVFFLVEVNLCRIFIVCLYLYFSWRSNYQEEEGWNTIIRFNPATFLCLSQGIT